MAQLSCPWNDAIKRATDCNYYFIIIFTCWFDDICRTKKYSTGKQQGFFTLKWYSSTWFSTKNYFVLACEKQSNCMIFAQACVEDLIFLLKWLMLKFHFRVSTVERVINKTKSSFMQIFVYLISFVRGMQDVYQPHTCIWRLASKCNHLIKIWRKRKFKIRTLLFRNLFHWSWKKFLSGFNTYVVNL